MVCLQLAQWCTVMLTTSLLYHKPGTQLVVLAASLHWHGVLRSHVHGAQCWIHCFHSKTNVQGLTTGQYIGCCAANGLPPMQPG